MREREEMKDVVMKERKRINERRRHGREREGVYVNERKETEIKRREREMYWFDIL